MIIILLFTGAGPRPYRPSVQLTENNASVEEIEKAPTKIGQMLIDEFRLPVLNLFVFE